MIDTFQDSKATPDAGEISRGARTPFRQRSARLAFRWFGTTFSPGAPVRRIRNHGLVAAVTGAAAAAVILIRLFLPTTVGMADRGDGFQQMCGLGVRNVRPWNYEKLTQYVYPQWIPHGWAGETCPSNADAWSWLSAPHLLAWLGQLLTPLLGWGPGLDTRAIAVVCAGLFGSLVAGFVIACPGRLPFRILAAAGLTAVMADGMFAVFFISPYPQAAVFLGLFGLFVSLLFLWRRDTVTVAGMIPVVLASLFVFTADPQTVALLPALALALWWRPSRRRRSIVGADPSAATSWLRGRAVAAVLVLVLSAGAVLVVASSSGKNREPQLYNAIFTEILPYSPHPEKDLAWFGISADLARYAGTSHGETGSAVESPTFEDFTSNVSNIELAGFYLSHPERLVGLCERGVQAMVRPQLGYLGHHMEQDGVTPYAQDERVRVVSSLLWAFGAAPVSVFGLQLLVLTLGLAVALRTSMGRAGVAVGRSATIVVISTWLLFWNVMFSQGQSDIYFRMLGPSFLTALCLPLLPMLAALLIAGRRR
ncbi:glycan biosynthesis hexose transferase WsfD [Arthrobacter sp. HLT1-20]